MKLFNIRVKVNGKLITIDAKPVDKQVMELLDLGVKPAQIPEIFNALPKHLLTFDTALAIVFGMNKWMLKDLEQKKSVAEWEYTLENLALEAEVIVKIILSSKSVNITSGKITRDDLWTNQRLLDVVAEYFERSADDIGPEEIETAVDTVIEKLLSYQK